MIFAGARSYHMIALHLPFMPIQTRITLVKISKLFNAPAPAVELKWHCLKIPALQHVGEVWAVLTTWSKGRLFKILTILFDGEAEVWPEVFFAWVCYAFVVMLCFGKPWHSISPPCRIIHCRWLQTNYQSARHQSYWPFSSSAGSNINVHDPTFIE